MKEKSWQLLNIDKTTNKAVIRQAYRAELPLYHPETDPEGFKALREAYEYAMHYADLPEIDNDFLFAPQTDETIESLSPEQQAVNQICLDYQMLLDDPERRYHIEQWHQFVSSFYDYPMEVIDLARWPLLEISYDASYLSFECTKVLADSLRWRQQLMTQSAEKVDYYYEFLNQIERGDYFDYSSLPTTSKAIQNVTLDYIYTLRWLFWERPTDELHYGLSQDTVIYLPDNSELMLKFANWYCAGRVANAALLDYALLYIEKKDIDAQTIIEWKYVVACQYSLMDDKEHALQSWLALYNSGHYQEKAISWLIYWCSVHSPNYLPLLIVAVNESLCMPVDTAEAQFFTIPDFSPTTIIRLAKLRKNAYSPEIMDFVLWALSQNWRYRQILLLLLCDDGNNRLFRLYRHAVMLRHGNETLLQAIIDDNSEDPFEQFILQNLQRQAQQNLTWLKGLAPVQEFKMWLYDEDKTVTIPQKFIPQSENNQYYFARMWLDRFRDLPLISQIRLYNNVNYSDMEMFDWPVCLEVKDYCHLPTPPDTSILAQDKTVYWQWYRHCMLIISLVIEPAKAAKYIKQDVDTFKLPVNSPIFSLFETIKQSDWQDETQLYSIINNNNKLTNCILSSYPDSIEYFIENPDNIDFDNICQKVEQMWQPKLANCNPVYLMLLMIILLNESDKKAELNKSLQKIVGNSAELQKIKESLQENWTYPFSKKNDNYNFNPQADQIVKLAERLANYYGLCDEDDILMLSTIKDDSDNDLVLRLCAVLLLAKNIENQNILNSFAYPVNKTWQYWRWNGRTTINGFLWQLLSSGMIILFFWLWILCGTSEPVVINILKILAGLNAIFAIKRRLNDTYNGARFFFTSRTLCMPIIMFPCWSKGLLVTNRYGRPVDK